MPYFPCIRIYNNFRGIATSPFSIFRCRVFRYKNVMSSAVKNPTSYICTRVSYSTRFIPLYSNLANWQLTFNAKSYFSFHAAFRHRRKHQYKYIWKVKFLQWKINSSQMLRLNLYYKFELILYIISHEIKCPKRQTTKPFNYT